MFDHEIGDATVLDWIVTFLFISGAVVLTALGTFATIPGTSDAVHGVILAIALGALTFGIINHGVSVRRVRRGRLDDLAHKRGADMP
jgi:hypothetical protein